MTLVPIAPRWLLILLVLSLHQTGVITSSLLYTVYVSILKVHPRLTNMLTATANHMFKRSGINRNVKASSPIATDQLSPIHSYPPSSQGTNMSPPLIDPPIPSLASCDTGQHTRSRAPCDRPMSLRLARIITRHTPRHNPLIRPNKLPLIIVPM